MARGRDSHLGLAPGDQGTRLRRALSNVGGLTFKNAHEGEFKVGPYSARVRLEPDDRLRVLREIESPPPPREALEINAHLPGNVRFAATGGRMALLADTRLDGQLHLTSSLGEIGEGFRGALQRRPRPRRKARPITPESVQDALDKTGLCEDAIVRLDDGWELRPRIRGEVTPVRLAIEGQRLRIGRVVVTGCSLESALFVAWQALCSNARLRHARLAARGEAVLAETCLHAGLIESEWLAHAVRAVATAAHHTGVSLEILARDPEVARRFGSMFFEANGSTPSLPSFLSPREAQAKKGGDPWLR
jgi:hypothetical protein